MRIVVFTNNLSLGGTEKAACFWAKDLRQRGHDVAVVSLNDGPRIADLIKYKIPSRIPARPNDPHSIADCINYADAIHSHAPGFPHEGDLLGVALEIIGRKIPVIQTNIFGKLENPGENEWVDFRLFISWTSCVQAARRSRKKISKEFFRKQSVVVYPVIDPYKAANFSHLEECAEELRASIGVCKDDVLFGRFSRPEPNKWTPLVLESFFSAHKQNPNIRLLLREPPAFVATNLERKGLAIWADSQPKSIRKPIILLRATSDPAKLSISQLACDAIIHTSSIGESFGYGIAEPLALERPVITHSVPWHDQAQLELVQHEECGLIANCRRTMSEAISRLANDRLFRTECGQRGRKHILNLADPGKSLARLETALRCAVEQRDNPNATDDFRMANQAAANLDRHQWGNSTDEFIHLKAKNAKISFFRWQKIIRERLSSKSVIA